MFNLIMIILPFIFPYYLLGENISSLILFIVALTFLILKKKEAFNINKNFLLWIGLLITVAFIMTFFLNATLYSFSGLSVYLNLFVYYISYCHIFVHQDKREFYFKWLLIMMSLAATYYLFRQGMLYGIRVRGNFGYANTYALFLLLTLILNQVITLKYNSIINLILMTTLFATGSRCTLLLLLVYLTILIFKKKKYMPWIITIMLSGITYSLINQLGIRCLFFLPILLYIMDKLKGWQCAIMGGIGVLFFTGTNTYERLLNFSIKNGSFLERVISFKDSIQAIKEYPFGQGIQSYEYSHFIYDTAFYDPKYLHNSVLQIMYDIGIIGGIIFLILIFSAYRTIVKSKQDSKLHQMIALICLFLHSLMEFDIAFSATFIVLGLLISLNSQQMMNPLSLKWKPLYSLLLIPSFYLLLYELLLGTTFSTQFPITDYRSNLLLATQLMQSNDWDQVLNQLKMADEKEANHPNIIWNLAYVYEKIGNIEESINYRLQSVKLQPYHQEAYREYYQLLQNQYDKTKDLIYFNKQQELITIYEQAISDQSLKANHLPNQLPLTFDELID